jgi:hypothetical protein
MCGVVPLWLHEMHVRIPESGEHDTTAAGDRLNAAGRSQVLSNRSDHPGLDEDRRIPAGWRFRRGVNCGMGDRQILRPINGRDKNEQSNDK